MTYEEQVRSAAEAVAGRGEKPTIERVRNELGGGSPNKIHPILQSWKAEQKAEQVVEHDDQVQADASTALVPMVPADVSAALDALSLAVRAAIQGAEDRERAAGRAAVDAVTSQLQAVQRQASAQVEAAQADLDAAESIIAELSGTNDDLAQASQALQQQLDVKAAEAEKLAADLAQALRDVEDSEYDRGVADVALSHTRDKVVEQAAEIERLRGQLESMSETAKVNAAELAAVRADLIRVSGTEAAAKERAASAERAGQEAKADLLAARAAESSARERAAASEALAAQAQAQVADLLARLGEKRGRKPKEEAEQE